MSDTDASDGALRDQLELGLSGLQLSLDSRQVDKLLAYLSLLQRWNRAYNLTAIDQPAEMVARHLLDSLSILPWLQGHEVLDAGTGAGLPGVPLAIARPEVHFRLVDSNGKKVRFLRQVRRELDLPNIEPIQARLESLTLDPPPDLLTARALAPLARLVEWHGRWLEQGATLLAMKAQLAESECVEVAAAYNVEIIDLEVPGIDGRRCLAVVSRKPE